MSETTVDGVQTVALPGLLRAARNRYGMAIRRALAATGYDDVPRNGIYVIGAIARSGAPLGQVIDELGVSKQAASQLVDTLVLRGYLERSVDPEDRRRMIVALTERGEAAAAVSRAVVDGIEAETVARVGADLMAHTRITLAALVHGGHDFAAGNDAAAELG